MVHSHDFYTQYQKAYETYTQLYGEQVCVFLQKGSFYEFYGQMDPNTQRQLNTGRKIIDFLGVQLHTYPEDGPGGTTGYYGGIPVWTLDKWAEKLTREGWSVVVIDEIKNGAGKVSRREVTRVLSPGTHIDVADPTKALCLASLWLDFKDGTVPPAFGVATADLTTGQVLLYEGRATGKPELWHTDDLRHFFQVYPPRELLLFIRGLGQGPKQQDLEGLRRTLYIPTAPIHIRHATPEQQGNFEDALTREVFLRETFKPRTALPLRTWLRCAPDGSSLQERALTALMRFAEDHASSLASCLQEPHLWHPTQSLQIINNALTQLNLIGSTGQQCVEDLFATPTTAMGKRSLTARLCSPVADHELIQKRQEEVTWLLEAESQKQKDTETCLGLTYDIARLHRTIIRGSLRATDVLQLHQSYQSVIQLWHTLRASPFEDEPKTIEESATLCVRELTAVFDLEKAVKAQEDPEEIGFMVTSVAPKSAEGEAKVAAVYKAANEWLRDLRAWAEVTADACYYKPTDKNMFCVHLTKAAHKQIETALKRANAPPIYKKVTLKTLTSAARLDHPALEGFQNDLDVAKAYLSRMIAAELPMACIHLAQGTRHVWQEIETWVIQVDLALSMAKTAKAQGWVKPQVLPCSNTDSSQVTIKNLRHPLIETQKRQSKYVTHNVSLGAEENSLGWLLYGMNASGKSSLMKAIGLAVLLAQVGSYVPATAMTLRPFRRIATRILNQDNLWAGLSSFAVEMSELREILAVADHQTLVLGDELCAGTESISGTAIVAAGIQHLHKAGARFVLATHLHDLMRLPAIKELAGLSVWHLHVEYDQVRDILVYHRTLSPGSGSSKYGLEVAKALHLPRDMIESAFEMRRALMGAAAPEDATKSHYNSSHTMVKCEACQSPFQRELETHHLQEQADAKHGRNSDGTALNHVRNLTTLCQGCHDKHHAGALHVGPVEDTSEGPVRSLSLSEFAFVPKPQQQQQQQKQDRSPFTKEQIAQIATLLKENPGLSPKLWCFQIKRQLEIEISEAQLKTLKKRGDV